MLKGSEVTLGLRPAPRTVLCSTPPKLLLMAERRACSGAPVLRATTVRPRRDMIAQSSLSSPLSAAGGGGGGWFGALEYDDEGSPAAGDRGARGDVAGGVCELPDDWFRRRASITCSSCDAAAARMRLGAT